MTLLLASATCTTAADGVIELAPRYTDSRHGFSLCPPAGTERTIETSPMRLATWRKRDAKTKAIAWTLSVLRASAGKEKVDLNAYSRGLVQSLLRKENFRVESAKVTKLSGKGAIDLSGVTGGRRRVWQRQVWVQAEPGRFIIVQLSGPAGMKAQLNTIFGKVLATLEIIDPKVAAASRKANLARGRKLLAELTDKKLAEILRTKPQWFLFRKKDKYIGFMKVVESPAKRENTNGCEVKVWLWLQKGFKGLPLRSKQIMFAAADRKTERWSRRVWVDLGKGKIGYVRDENGIRQDNTITCKLEAGGRAKARTVVIPPGNIPIYQPKAINCLLWRLMDLKNKTGYAFAVYNTRANGFDMRTLTVVGPEQIELDGKKVEAVRVTDQAAEDAGAETTWLDSKGFPLRAGQGDVVVIAVTRSEVLRKFPRAERTIASMNK